MTFGFFTGSSRRAWWANDSRHAYFIDYQGSYQCVRLIEVNTETGATKTLFEETSDTYINLQVRIHGQPAAYALTRDQ